jgi:anhydro-N-acetylmuramic acid kinase
MTRHVVGCMSGTSLDAIDAALVRIEGVGLAMNAAPIGFASIPLGDMVDSLRRLARQTPMTSREIAELSCEFSLRHVDAIRQVVARHKPDLIAAHGQTVFHAPPMSWQLLTPAVLAAAFSAPLVFDLRAADLAAGGQGAPITPVADFLLFRNETESRIVLNLGGFANYTWLPPASAIATPAIAQIRGGDLCACNQLLDGLALELLHLSFDSDGAVATTGRVIPALHAQLCEMLRGPGGGRSLGTAHEPHDQIPSLGAAESPADVLATACEAIAATIAAGLPQADTLLVAGGGAKNRHLVARIGQHARLEVRATAEHGVPVEQREAIEIAILGALCQDRIPITLPQITGCREPAPVSGAWILP